MERVCVCVCLQGLNPDVKYEVQYSSYVNVTLDGFVILKRAVKTESFALQVSRAHLEALGRDEVA